jgi:hypothetical protein
MSSDTSIVIESPLPHKSSSLFDASDPPSPFFDAEEALPEITTESKLRRGDDLQSNVTYDLPRRIKKRLPSGPVSYTKQPNLRVMQKWEGTLIEVSGDLCVAHIRDLIDENQPVEEITFNIEEVSRSDLQFVITGAVFYWRIGYIDEVNGQRRRTSDFSFRRLPQWREKDIETIKKDVSSMLDILPQDEADSLRKHFEKK